MRRQSIMAALSGSWMSNHPRQSMLQSIMRGLGLFVSYELKATETRVSHVARRVLVSP